MSSAAAASTLEAVWIAEQERVAAAADAAAPSAVAAADIAIVAGADITFSTVDPDVACVCIAVMRLTATGALHPITVRHRMARISVDYIPGFLAFREVPAIASVLEELRRDAAAAMPGAAFPDVLLCDGNGRLHPRRAGVASHLGVVTGIPAVGVAKNYFYIDDLAADAVKAASQLALRGLGDAVLLRGRTGRVWGAMLRASRPPSSKARHAHATSDTPVVRVLGALTPDGLDASDCEPVDRLATAGGADAAAGAAADTDAASASTPVAAGIATVFGGASAAAEPVFGAAAAAIAAAGGGSGDRASPAASAGSATAALDACKPLFVSVGHRISLLDSLSLVLRCCMYRVPEPIRIADKVSRGVMEEWEKSRPRHPHTTAGGSATAPAAAGSGALAADAGAAATTSAGGAAPSVSACAAAGGPHSRPPFVWLDSTFIMTPTDLRRSGVL